MIITNTNLTVKMLDSFLECKWNDFVFHQPDATFYHLLEWKYIFEKTFNEKTYYLMAIRNGRVEGILPLILCEHIIFGKRLVSLPYLNFGGICAVNREAEHKLINQSKLITSITRAKYLELRHCQRIAVELPATTNKVSMTIDLESDHEMLWKRFSGNLRTEIRKAQKLGLSVKYGREKYLNDFYYVYSRNYRTHGTPVHPKRFFDVIVQDLKQNILIFVVYQDGFPVGAAMNGYFKNKVEGLWAASLTFLYPHLRINYLLYWEMIKNACQHGYKSFNLGRSSKDSGALNFKEKWLAIPIQLYWEYYLNSNDKLPQLNVENPKLELLIKIWRKLPVGVTNLIGPLFSAGIP